MIAGSLAVTSSIYLNSKYSPIEPINGTVPGYHFLATAQLEGFQDSRLKRQAGEDDYQFAVRALDVVGQTIYHCEDNRATQSWLLRLAAFLRLKKAEDQGLLVPIKLKCGLCHQTAYILARVLRAEGISAFQYGLSGHVVTRANLNGEDYYLDPDFSVGPFKVYDPNLGQKLKSRYANAGVNEQRAEFIAKLYTTTDDNTIYHSVEELDGIANKQQKWLMAEKFIEYALGVLGIIMAFQGLRILMAWRRRLPRHQAGTVQA